MRPGQIQRKFRIAGRVVSIQPRRTVPLLDGERVLASAKEHLSEEDLGSVVMGATDVNAAIVSGIASHALRVVVHAEVPRRLDAPRFTYLSDLIVEEADRLLQPEHVFVDVVVVDELNGAIYADTEWRLRSHTAQIRSGLTDAQGHFRANELAHADSCQIELTLRAVPSSARHIASADREIVKVRRGDNHRVRPFSIPTSTKVVVVVEAPSVDVLEVGEVSFGLSRAVLLPVGSAQNERDPGPAEPAALDVLTAALTFFHAHDDKLLLVVGHTDSSGGENANEELSRDRARSVLLYLAGDHDAWAAHSMGHFARDDVAAILRAVSAARRELSCDPGSATPDEITAALANFRNGFNGAHGGALSIDGELCEDDWRAFATVYDLEVAKRLSICTDALALRRKMLNLAGEGALGLGEQFSGAYWESTAAERKHDRRVDLLFFDPIEFSDVEVVGEQVYGDDRRFKHRVVGAVPLMGNDEIAIRLVNEEGLPVPNVKFELDLPDGGQHVGVLDAHGAAAVATTEAGTCTLRFSEIEAADWEADPDTERELPEGPPSAAATEDVGFVDEPGWDDLDDELEYGGEFAAMLDSLLRPKE